MQVAHFPDARSFVAANWAELSREPELNNVLLTVSSRAARYGDNAQGWAIRDGPSLRLAAFRTPPHYLLLSAGNADAARDLASAIQQGLPGATGTTGVAREFARAWSFASGCAATLSDEMTLYVISSVADFPLPPGALDMARSDETDALIRLSVAAAIAMKLSENEQDEAIVARVIERAIAEERQFVWREGDEIRSIARYDGLEDSAARIGVVYTPPQFQGRGFGTAITGALTQALLASGQKPVCLFADDTNATSNGIYQRLGYRARARFSSFAFELQDVGG